MTTHAKEANVTQTKSWPELSPEKGTRIGWIGTGVMGHSMVGHLIDAGYPCSIQTRTRSKAEDLIARGATWCDHPSEIGESCDVVFTIVGFPDDVQEVYFGDAGLLKTARPGQILVDMTTSRPALAVEIADAAASRGAAAIDAPVSGGDSGAKAGTLSIMIGGDEEPVSAVMPLFGRMGKTVVHQGGPGLGQHTKVVNQTLIASGMIGVCEALLYAYRAGLDIEQTLRSVTVGAAGSWALTNLGPRIVDGDFQPGFFVEHFVKDMGIALEEAAAMNLALPGLALSRQLYIALKAQGHGRLGTQALILALAQLNDMIDPENPQQVRSGSAGAAHGSV